MARRSASEVEGDPKLIQKDTTELFKMLWKMGLDPKVEDVEQRTPLGVAAACGNGGILELFKQEE